MFSIGCKFTNKTDVLKMNFHPEMNLVNRFSGSRKSEVRRQKSEGRRQKAEGRRQKSEDGSQKTEE